MGVPIGQVKIWLGDLVPFEQVAELKCCRVLGHAHWSCKRRLSPPDRSRFLAGGIRVAMLSSPNPASS